MKMRIEFETDNAAFEDTRMESELTRIFLDIIDRAANKAETGRGIADSNGNRIGQWTIE